MSLPRPLARLALVGTTLVALLAAGMGIASAHVTVSPTSTATAGGFGTVVFSVPDESDTASTVRVRIQIPNKTPLASVRVKPVPGWTFTETSSQLPQPVTTDDGQITTAVSVVDITAAPGGGIAPGQFQEFTLSGGPFPKADQMVFNVIQTYSDGTEVAWIDPTIPGQPEPQHPAPVLKLAAATGGAAGDSAPPASGDQSSTAAAPGGASWPAWLGVGLGALALVVAVSGVLLARRGPRRTVSS